jgi:hypothetical protein
MKFRVHLLSQCPGGGHIHGEISINGGAFRPFELSREEIKAAAAEENREQVVQRLRSVILESGATTPAQQKAAVEAREWEV